MDSSRRRVHTYTRYWYWYKFFQNFFQFFYVWNFRKILLKLVSTLRVIEKKNWKYQQSFIFFLYLSLMKGNAIVWGVSSAKYHVNSLRRYSFFSWDQKKMKYSKIINLLALQHKFKTALVSRQLRAITLLSVRLETL